jgi:hypothetical protein
LLDLDVVSGRRGHEDKVSNIVACVKQLFSRLSPGRHCFADYN